MNPTHEPIGLPHAKIEAALPVLHERMEAAAAALQPGSAAWQKLFDVALQGMFDLFVRAAGADEGTLWLLDPAAEALVPAYNNGPDAEKLVGVYQQPLSQGIVSSVFITQLGLSESWVYRNAQHDARVNRLVGKVTAHMIAVPVFFGGDARGVLSAVKLRDPDAADPPPFGVEGFAAVTRLAQLLGQLVDHRLQGGILGSRR